MERYTGKVKWFNVTKGFGFIIPENGGPDVFVDSNALHEAGLKSLSENDRVSYELTENSKINKVSASDIELIR